MSVVTPVTPMTTFSDLLSESIDSQSGSAAVSEVLPSVSEVLPSLSDMPEVVDTIPSTIEDIAEVISEVTDDVAEVDADDLAETVAEIEQSVASDLTSVGDSITLSQVQDLFETYFGSITEMLSGTEDIAESTPSELIATTLSDEGESELDDSFAGFSYEPRRGGGRGRGRSRGGRGGRRGSGGGCNRSGDSETADMSSLTMNPEIEISSDVSESLIDQSMIDGGSFDDGSIETLDTFEVSRADVSLENLISGARRRGREAVNGTGDDDLIGAGRGRDRLSGRAGADNFLFDEADGGCGRRQADVISDFDSEQGDRILLDSAAFEGDGVVSVAESRRDFQQLRNSGDCDFIYYQPRGGLYYNENGEESGFGEGGLLAAIKGAPELTAEQIALV